MDTIKTVFTMMVIGSLFWFTGCADTVSSPPTVVTRANTSPPTVASPVLTDTPTPAPISAPPTDSSPQIKSFTAQTQGHDILLTWDAVGTMASICPLLTSDELSCQCQWVDEGKGIHSSTDVSLSGSKTWAFNEIGAKYTGFRLTVGGVSGEFATAQAPISVSACSQDWFFNNSTEMCPMASVTSLATAQRFEHGQMIWIKELDKFYIFYDSGLQAGPTNLGIITGPLTLKPQASIDNRTGETPPPGFVEPVNNFGLIWRGEVEGYEDVRERLGWAKEPAFDFETIYQCEASCYDSSNCYLRSPEGKILNLYYMMHFGDYWQEESN